jgi:hypothetical protein
VGFVKATGLEITAAPGRLDTLACALHSWF